ncbi:hypothetical protein JOM56_013636 [Amanita muscaria]
MADSMSLVRRNYRHPTDTVGLSSVAQKARVSEIVGRIVNRLKDKAERYGHGNYYQGILVPPDAQKQVLGAAKSDVGDEYLGLTILLAQTLSMRIRPPFPSLGDDPRYRSLARQRHARRPNGAWEFSNPQVDGIIRSFQEQKDQVMFDGFGIVVNALAACVKPYGPYLTQIASTISGASITKVPSITTAIGIISNVVGVPQMNPLVNDLRLLIVVLSLFLHETYLLRPVRPSQGLQKGRAVVNSFSYTAKSLGPQDVLSVLLTNLRMQERQDRVCSTVAIAIGPKHADPRSMMLNKLEPAV